MTLNELLCVLWGLIVGAMLGKQFTAIWAMVALVALGLMILKGWL